MSGSCREAPQKFGRPSRMSGVIGRPSQKSGSPYRMSGSERETLPDVREWSGDRPRCT